MGQKFTINVRKIEDYEIEVTPVELARLLKIDEADIARLLDRAGTITNGEDVLAYLCADPKAIIGQFERNLNNFTDRVAHVEMHEPRRVEWVKTDRIVDSVVIAL